jgi:hypothetical protein
MHSATAEAPTGEISISQAIRHKTNNRKDIKLRNTTIRCYCLVTGCDDVTCNSIQLLAVLPVSTLHIATARQFRTTVPRVSSNKLQPCCLQNTNNQIIQSVSNSSLPSRWLRQPFGTAWNRRGSYCLYV